MSYAVILRANNETPAMSITLSNCIIVLNELEQPIYISLDKIHCIICQTGVIDFWYSNETF
jgi:hypothetical protein